jgi:hypothetical protein
MPALYAVTRFGLRFGLPADLSGPKLSRAGLGSGADSMDWLNASYARYRVEAVTILISFSRTLNAVNEMINLLD